MVNGYEKEDYVAAVQEAKAALIEASQRVLDASGVAEEMNNLFDAETLKGSSKTADLLIQSLNNILEFQQKY